MYPDVITTNGVNINHPIFRVGNKNSEQQSIMLSSIRGDEQPFLEYNYDVIVLGDIINATVTTSGTLHCKGSVINSNLISHGDITIEGSCINTNIYTRGEISLRSISQSDILSEKTISIHSECKDSSIQAVESIYANKASVSDSLLSAGSSISVRRVLRTKEDSNSRLCVGAAFMKRRKEYYYKQQLENLNYRLEIVNEVINTLKKPCIYNAENEKSNSELLRLSSEKQAVLGVIEYMQTEFAAYKSFSSKRFGEAIIVITSYADNGICVEIDGIEIEIGLCTESTQFKSDGINILRT